MASRDIPNPFREGFRPSPQTTKPTVQRDQPATQPADPTQGMSPEERFGYSPVVNAPSVLTNLRDR
jgi:hypothetical protein